MNPNGGRDRYVSAGAVGCSAALGESFGLMPEFRIVFPIARDRPRRASGSATDIFGSGVAFQIGLGFLFGSGS